jgi:ribosomal protein S27E
MAEGVNLPQDAPLDPPDEPQGTVVWEDERAMKLVAEMLAGNITDIRPQLDFDSQLGFFYPYVESLLEVKGEEVLAILESLASKEILIAKFFEKLLRCPQCQSVNLRPSTNCPRCGSGNIARGRVLEHFVCKFVGLEDEFVSRGRYVCPKCRQELRTIGSDYQSLGLLYKCRDCDNVFNQPMIKWRCLNCSAVMAEDKIAEINVYSYSLNDARRGWLEFELQPKPQLIEFLKQHGYEVTEHATVKGRSGAEHKIDILASRDDGVVTYNIAIGVKVAGDEVALNDIFDFDDKAYDIGIHDKVLVVVPGLRREAEKFASQQRIKVLEVRDLETVLSSGAPRLSEQMKKEPFEFKSKSQLIDYLKHLGYQVEEDAEVQGRSGAQHNLDILATKDDGIVIHHIAIGVEVSEKPVELDKVFDFDDKAYDIGILDKVFIAVPGLSREAEQFARRQKIRVFEVKELEPSG